MKKLILAATAVGALLIAGSPAAAQRYGRSHTSIGVTIGTGYGPYYGSYGYDPYAYGYDPYYSYSTYPAYGYARSYDNYYGRDYYSNRRHYRRHHRDDRYRRDWDYYRR